MATLYLPALRTYQLSVLTSTARDDLTVSAPQLGKTLTGQMWLLSAAWKHGRDPRPWWWVAPTYKQARDGLAGLVELAQGAEVLAHATTTPPLFADLTNGARIEGRSWERPDGLWGPTVLGGVVDEFGRLNSGAYTAISTRRAETISQGYGWFRWLGNVGEIGGPAEDLWKMAEGGAAGFASRRWTWRDRADAHVCSCPIVSSELDSAPEHDPACSRGIYLTFVAREADRMSDPQFRATYCAEWIDHNLLPVYLFDRDKHVDANLQLDRGHPLHLAVDFNVDPMAWIIGSAHGEEAWAHDEISIGGGATTAEACREFIRRYPDRKWQVTVFGDASGGARKTSASQTDYQIIREMLGGYYHTLQVRVPRANPAVADRVNAFNAMLCSASGKIRYRVHPRCTGLVNDLARVSWKQGTRDIDKSDKRLTHYTDADGYRVHELFPVQRLSVVEVGVGPEDAIRADSMLNVGF